MIREHRNPALPLIRGAGLEIGALHEPFPVPEGTAITYADTLTVDQAARLFPEIDAARITKADRILNLDVDGLVCFPEKSFDFVIISHVLEHLANPIRVVGEVFRVLRTGGRAIIAVPDMRFTFDRSRKITPFKHLMDDYQNAVTENSDEHYLDFLGGVAPRYLPAPPKTSPTTSPASGPGASIATFGTRIRFGFSGSKHPNLRSFRPPLYESGGDSNAYEYFSVWERES